MGAHGGSGGRRRSGVHREGPVGADTPASPRRGRHAAPAAPEGATLAATVETLAAEAVAEENRLVDAVLAHEPPVEPVPVEPVPVEPVAVDPAVEPAVEPAAGVEPAAVEPAEVEPGVIEPAAAVEAPVAALEDVVDLPPRTGRRRRLPVQTVARALRWTVAGALVPGLAHLAAGKRRVGLVMAGSFATLLFAATVLLTAVPRTRLMQISVKPGELHLVIAVCLALALIWVLVVVSSWAVHKPDQMRAGQRVLATGVVAVMSVGVAAPFAVGARTAYAQLDLINTLFPHEDASPSVVLASMPSNSTQAALGPATGFFANKPRVNVLLLGGDGGADRTGVRTDTMILASIDTKSGRTVLISLPRNMMRVQFPPGTEMARRFPNGFTDMLNAVYTYASADRTAVPGAKNPGAELIKEAFAWTIAQPVDYFVLVNLDGFRDIVDAFGGVTINVNRRLPIGGAHDANGNVTELPHAYLEPGRRKLNGYEALWYGRSRFDSDDYARMNRQRCLLGAIAKQASPINVLTNFTRLASAAKRIILTDIPQKALPDLLVLANKAKHVKITSLTFTRTAAFDPSNPNFSYVQEQVRLALAEADKAPNATPSAAAKPATKSGSKTGAKSGTKPVAAPKPTSGATSLDSACGY
ncbi:MAG TPA: LCP family protein [Sporichthya sp.]|nr:LCP family protein [Sporichthya sp.]